MCIRDRAGKYPDAPQQFKWQFLFASHKLSRDPRTGKFHRHHIHRDSFARHLNLAVANANVLKPISAHTLPLFCDPSITVGNRHSDDPRVAGARRYFDDDDLHSCFVSP